MHFPDQRTTTIKYSWLKYKITVCQKSHHCVFRLVTPNDCIPRIYRNYTSNNLALSRRDAYFMLNLYKIHFIFANFVPNWTFLKKHLTVFDRKLFFSAGQMSGITESTHHITLTFPFSFQTKKCFVCIARRSLTHSPTMWLPQLKKKWPKKKWRKSKKWQPNHWI